MLAIAPSEALQAKVDEYKSALAKLEPADADEPIDPIVAELTAISELSPDTGAKVRQGIMELLAEEKKQLASPTAAN